MLDCIHPELIALLSIVQENQHCQFYSDYAKHMLGRIRPESIALLLMLQGNKHC